MLEFDLVRKEEPVKLKNASGVVEDYTLRELSGEERDKFLTSMSNRMRFGPDGKPQGLKSFDGVEAYLVSMSLIAPDGTKVSEVTIKGWPGTVQKNLFLAAQKLSGLDDSAEETAKND